MQYNLAEKNMHNITGCTKLRNEIETKRNITQRNILKCEMKRNATKRNILKCETQRNILKCKMNRKYTKIQ